MSKDVLTKEDNEKIEVCKFLRDELVKDFKELSKNKKNVTQADLEYELAKDRKTGLALKSIMVEIGIEKLNDKRKTVKIN